MEAKKLIRLIVRQLVLRANIEIPEIIEPESIIFTPIPLPQPFSYPYEIANSVIPLNN
jgi:hypothetical protein